MSNGDFSDWGIRNKDVAHLLGLQNLLLSTESTFCGKQTAGIH